MKQLKRQQEGLVAELVSQRGEVLFHALLEIQSSTLTLSVAARQVGGGRESSSGHVV
jgi:hypothetical protein